MSIPYTILYHTYNVLLIAEQKLSPPPKKPKTNQTKTNNNKMNIKL